MPILFSDTIVQLVIGFTILTIMILAAIYILGFLRSKPLQQERTTSEQLDYFWELKSEGKLSPEEYRKIKKRLSAHLVDEWEKRNQKSVPETPTNEPTVLWARQYGIDPVDPENSEDTQIAGRSETGDNGDTVVGR